MIPFGRSVYLWRLERDLTQEGLARKAGLPRPTVSDVERGVMEPSLRTIRRLADALQVRPGLLVDGLCPGQENAVPLGREAMERIAEAVLGRARPAGAFEKALVPLLKEQFSHRWCLAGISGRLRGSRRRTRRSWLLLKSLLTPAEFKSLISRVEKHASIFP